MLSRVNGSFSEQRFEDLLGVMARAYTEGGNPPFAGDLENELYKCILQGIRDFNTSEAANK